MGSWARTCWCYQLPVSTGPIFLDLTHSPIMQFWLFNPRSFRFSIFHMWTSYSFYWWYLCIWLNLFDTFLYGLMWQINGVNLSVLLPSSSEDAINLITVRTWWHNCINLLNMFDPSLLKGGQPFFFMCILFMMFCYTESEEKKKLMLLSISFFLVSLQSLCSWDPCKRPTAVEVLQHRFFQVTNLFHVFNVFWISIFSLV